MKDVVNHILGVKDNVVINNNIKDIIGQLPIRMTKSKFIERIQNSISVYKGADIDSLDNFVYVIRTCAMLHSPEGKDTYFDEFAPFLKELAQIDFQSLNQDSYRILHEKMDHTVGKINELSDLYVTIQKIVNLSYAYTLLKSHKKYDVKVDTTALQIIQEICSLFENDAMVLQLQVETLLTKLEGKLEESYQDKQLLEAVLDEIIITYSVKLPDR